MLNCSESVDEIVDVVVVTKGMKLNRRRSRRIVPYPTGLTSRTDGDSEHYRLCWRILIRPSCDGDIVEVV